jgi:hypothetical protein
MNDPKPPSQDDGSTNSKDDMVVIVYDDSPGDTTVRPMRPEIPREWPRPQLPPRPPAQDDEKA